MKYRYKIIGLDCPNCAAKLEGNINQKDGISSAKINFLTERLTVESDLSESEVYSIASSCATAFSRDVRIEK